MQFIVCFQSPAGLIVDEISTSQQRTIIDGHHANALIVEPAKIGSLRARPPIIRRGVEQHDAYLVQGGALARQIVDAEHGGLSIGLRVPTLTKRSPVSNGASQQACRARAIGMVAIGVEIEAEGLIDAGFQLCRQPERQLGCAVPADDQMCAARCLHPEYARSPTIGREPQTGDRPRPWQRPDE